MNEQPSTRTLNSKVLGHMPCSSLTPSKSSWRFPSSKGKMGEAVSTEGVDYKKAYGAVDKAQAKETVDAEKASKVLIGR